MRLGLYEAHLPVSNLANSIQFYSNLGLKLAYQDEDTAFFWIEEKKSWIGLWEGDEYKTPYHPSLRHFAFGIEYEEMKNALAWLNDKGIEPVPFGRRTSIEPFVRPWQGNASVYFQDPDGNSLEFMCYVEVPSELKLLTEKFSLDEWETVLKDYYRNK